MKILALVPLALALSGCAIDLGQLADRAARGSIAFEEPHAWSCHEQLKSPTPSGAIEDCSICRNRTTTPQRVTLKSVPSDLPSGGAVMLCQSSAKILEEPSLSTDRSQATPSLPSPKPPAIGGSR